MKYLALVVLAILALAWAHAETRAEHGEEDEEGDRAKAALELARAKSKTLAVAKTPPQAEVTETRTREGMECEEGISAGLAKAKAESKALVMWIGLKCSDFPATRRALADCIHAHAEDWEGDRTRCLIVRTRDGDYYRFRRVDASAVRALLTPGTPIVVPPPLSYYAPAPPVFSRPVYFVPSSPVNCRT